MGAEGLLLQLDGSRHDWLEGRGPWLTLVGAIDDATGSVPAAVFRDQEDAAGYLEILRDTIEAKGIPSAIYRDRHGIFAPTNQHPDDATGPAGGRSLSQVGRALVELGIGSIVAGSPQAKGRIERLWGTFQDRLVTELRLAGVADLAGANAFLGSYLPRHNARFAIPAADPVAAWRAVPTEVRLERVLVFKDRRKVARDNTIRLAGRVLQLPHGTGPSSYTGKLVEVHVRLDGAIVAFDGERQLGVMAAPSDPGQLRARHDDRPEPGLVPAAATMPWTPPPDHPWERVRPDSKLYRQRLTDSLGFDKGPPAAAWAGASRIAPVNRNDPRRCGGVVHSTLALHRGAVPRWSMAASVPGSRCTGAVGHGRRRARAPSGTGAVGHGRRRTSPRS